MKVSAALLAVPALATEKKVPPRHPMQRLNRLNLFAEEWLTDNLPTLPSRSNWEKKFKSNADRMTKAFNRSICGFYDPNLFPHGGPDPNPKLRPNMTPRNRRSEGSELDLVDLTSEDGFESDDGSLLRYDKNNPMLGIKQITTGYRKWAQRFINECNGQRKFNYQANRMQRWFQTLGKHWVATQPQSTL